MISLDVLWLVSGGIALGLALDKTGLAELVVHSIPFDQYSPNVVILGAAILCLLMASFMSHTEAANLVIPIMASLRASMTSLNPLGGEVTLILVVTLRRLKGCHYRSVRHRMRWLMQQGMYRANKWQKWALSWGFWEY